MKKLASDGEGAPEFVMGHITLAMSCLGVLCRPWLGLDTACLSTTFEVYRRHL